MNQVTATRPAVVNARVLSKGHRYAVSRIFSLSRDEVGMRENLTRTLPQALVCVALVF